MPIHHPSTTHFFKPCLGTRADAGATSIYHLPSLENKDTSTQYPSSQQPEDPCLGNIEKHSRRTGFGGWIHIDGSEDAGIARAGGNHRVGNTELTCKAKGQKSMTPWVLLLTDRFVQMQRETQEGS